MLSSILKQMFQNIQKGNVQVLIFYWLLLLQVITDAATFEVIK